MKSVISSSPRVFRASHLRTVHGLVGGVCLAAILGCGATKTDSPGSDAGSDPADGPGPVTAQPSEGSNSNGDGPGSESSSPEDGATNDATGGGMSDAASSEPAPAPGTGGGFVTIEPGEDGALEVLCGSTPCACSDGLDNDGDGVADGFDSECTGPFDNDEGSFATGIPGDNVDPKWQDCFFDGNSGAGDDRCRYHTDCLTGDRPADDPSCVLSAACVEFCQPLTPPGCDCFGCCEVPFDGSTVHVVLANTCSLAELDDEGKCPRCEPSSACNNECGECEICLGETAADLPDSCGSTPTTPTTPPGDGPDAGPTPTPTTPTTPTQPGTPTGDPGDAGTPTNPDEPTPINSCDNNQPCTADSACASGSYCRLGCCSLVPQVR